MLIVSKENIDDKISGGGFKTAVIYDQQLRGRDPGHLPYFERYDEETTEDLLNKIDKFSKTYPGIFSIVLKKTPGGQNACLVQAQFEGSKKPQEQGSVNLNGLPGFESPEMIEQRILNKLKTQMETQRLQAENNILRAKLQGIETTGGKLANMIETWIEAKFLGKKSPSLQGTDEATTETKKEVNPEELKIALGKLCDVLGADTLIKLSKKLQDGDPIILMVKNYANN